MRNSIKNSWQSVSIVPGSHACKHAEALRVQRFLARNAPRLPLPDCTTQDACECKYRRYPDRRAGPRRSEDQVAGKRTTVNPERRRPGERREPR